MNNNEINETSETLGQGTHNDPVRYGRIKKDDPNRAAKLEKQREQFSDDAGAGKVICLTELFGNHGL